MILWRPIEVIKGIAYINLKADAKVQKIIIWEKNGTKVTYTSVDGGRYENSENSTR